MIVFKDVSKKQHHLKNTSGTISASLLKASTTSDDRSTIMSFVGLTRPSQLSVLWRGWTHHIWMICTPYGGERGWRRNLIFDCHICHRNSLVLHITVTCLSNQIHDHAQGAFLQIINFRSNPADRRLSHHRHPEAFGFSVPGKVPHSSSHRVLPHFAQDQPAAYPAQP